MKKLTEEEIQDMKAWSRKVAEHLDREEERYLCVATRILKQAYDSFKRGELEMPTKGTHTTNHCILLDLISMGYINRDPLKITQKGIEALERDFPTC